MAKLSGGLGNQMFMYALGRHLACLNRTELKLDASGYKTYDKRSYALNAFTHLKASMANSVEIQYYRSWAKSRMPACMRLAAARVRNRPVPMYIEEKDLAYDPVVLGARGDLYLSGYWQSEKYFIAIRDRLLEDFAFGPQANRHVEDWMERIASTPSVAVHIRRGDYVTDPYIAQVHGTCDPAYYVRAIEEVARRLDQPRYFVFSDDTEWVLDNFQCRFPWYLVSDPDGLTIHDELRLMSHCRHGIIANSSFSWWAAWLNRNPDKMIFAPRRWFADQSKEDKDILPRHWVKL